MFVSVYNKAIINILLNNRFMIKNMSKLLLVHSYSRIGNGNLYILICRC